MEHNFLDIEGRQREGNSWRNAVFGILLAVLAFGIFSGGKFAYETVIATSLREKTTDLFSEQKVLATGLPVTSTAPIPVVITPPPLPELTGKLPSAETFSAESIFAKDHDTGVVLFAKEGYTTHAMASISKLMSALVLLEHKPDFTSTTEVVGNDSMDNHVFVGETYTLEDLWKAGLIGSSNKAILSLVNATGDQDAFVERMNQKALELGMTDTHFFEPTGLDQRNVSTASDIALLLGEALRHEKIADTLIMKEVIVETVDKKKSHHIWSTDWLLLGWVQTDLKILGGKTGFIDASGYNFAARLENDKGQQLDIVILGANKHETRFSEASDIAKAVFAAYTWPETGA